jgi:hypothetical protein
MKNVYVEQVSKKGSISEKAKTAGGNNSIIFH